MQHFGKEFVSKFTQWLFHPDQRRLVISRVESGDVWPEALVFVGKSSTDGIKYNTGS